MYHGKSNDHHLGDLPLWQKATMLYRIPATICIRPMANGGERKKRHSHLGSSLPRAIMAEHPLSKYLWEGQLKIVNSHPAVCNTTDSFNSLAQRRLTSCRV